MDVQLVINKRGKEKGMTQAIMMLKSLCSTSLPGFDVVSVLGILFVAVVNGSVSLISP